MLKLNLKIILTVILLAIPALAQSKSEQGTYAIRNARIVTVTNGVIERGTIIVKNGRIEAVGANVAVPKDAKLIDATGLSVYPGLIDTNTSLGLTEIGQGSPGTVDTTELGDFNSNMKAITAVNPHSELIPVARMNGVTTVLTCPGGGLISGQCALMNLDGWTQHDMKLVSPAAMQMNYPAAGGGGRGGGFAQFFGAPNDQARLQRERRLESLGKKLEDAQNYSKAKDAAAADKSIPARAIDLGLEALIPVIKGEVPVLMAANGEREIKGAIELAAKFKLKLVITGGDDAIKVAKELKEKNIPVVLGAVLALPGSEDAAYDESYARAGELHKAGVKIALTTSDAASDIRLLPYHAGTAAAFGLPKDEALKAVTINPAQIFGVDKILGSIEAGKLANLVITDGDILEFRTKIKQMFINGRPVDMSNKHQRLNEKFKDRP